MRLVLVLLGFVAAQSQPAPELRQLLARLSKEADTFSRMAPLAVAEETLEQRARVFTRPGVAAFQTREIVSEYTIGRLTGSPGLHEFRQVVSVDGRRVLKPEIARHSLSLGIASPDDRARKRLLEEFQAYGLAGAAVDFGPIILLFTTPQIEAYTFTAVRTTRVGADHAIVLSYRQAGRGPHLLVFQGRQTVRQPLGGEVFLRRSDGLPLRIAMHSTRQEGNRTFVDEGTVDYAMTPHGFLAPVAVIHRSLAGGKVTVEHRFRYANVRKFGAETTLKFTEVPESH